MNILRSFCTLLFRNETVYFTDIFQTSMDNNGKFIVTTNKCVQNVLVSSVFVRKVTHNAISYSQKPKWFKVQVILDRPKFKTNERGTNMLNDTQVRVKHIFQQNRSWSYFKFSASFYIWVIPKQVLKHVKTDDIRTETYIHLNSKKTSISFPLKLAKLL